MPEKNHFGWPDRPAVQKAFDALRNSDPQRLYNTLTPILTDEQKAAVYAELVPEPSKEDQVAALQQVRETLAKHGVDTAAVDAKIDDLGKEKGGEAHGDEENAQGQR